MPVLLKGGDADAALHIDGWDRGRGCTLRRHSRQWQQGLRGGEPGGGGLCWRAQGERDGRNSHVCFGGGGWVGGVGGGVCVGGWVGGGVACRGLRQATW